MQRYLGAMLAAVLILAPANPARADEATNAVLDKAIKALGGEDKLGKLEAFSWKSKGKITINDNDNEIIHGESSSSFISLPFVSFICRAPTDPLFLLLCC